MCHLSLYTLKLKIWLPNRSFGCHLGPYIFKMHIWPNKHGCRCHVGPYTINICLISQIKHYIMKYYIFKYTICYCLFFFKKKLTLLPFLFLPIFCLLFHDIIRCCYLVIAVTCYLSFNGHSKASSSYTSAKLWYFFKLKHCQVSIFIFIVILYTLPL